jgi:probable O-glycosylation ligase (exosortase A-associated)
MVYSPFVGLLFWMWLGFMNPHRLTWGFAFDLPFVQLAAIATLLGLVFSKEQKRLPITGTTVLWLVFSAWVTVTSIFAMNQDLAWPEWWRFFKIQIMTLMMLLLLSSRTRIWWAVTVIAGSIVFYGVKGGIFTILSGGQHMVLGPRGSFIAGNTEIAFAIVIALPLLWFLRGVVTQRWLRIAIGVAFGLSLVSVIGSYSRGALLALGAMLAFLWLRTQGKLATGLIGGVALLVALLLMPDKWFDRMGSIGGEIDRSEEGRINAWWFAYHLANDHPVVGGGFRAFTPELFLRYAPEPDFFRDAHSIFFEVLGEHGYVGLLLFLALGIATLVRAMRNERLARDHLELAWAAQLSRMCQVALIGYVVGGLFLGLAYFDLPYAVMAVVVATGVVVERERSRLTVPQGESPGSSVMDGVAAVAERRSPGSA